MSPETRMLLAFLALYLFVTLLLVTHESRGQSQEQAIRCENGVCLIDQQHLELLVQLAKRAEEYRNLCGWDK